MKKIWRTLPMIVLAVSVFVPGGKAQNVTTYILQSPSLAQAQAACLTYGMVMVSTIHDPDTYIVQVSASVPADVLKQWVEHDPNVRHLEVDSKVSPPEKSVSVPPYVPSLPATSYVADGNLIRLYGKTAWLGYIQQPAMYSMNAADTVAHNATGAGIVAVIDTGIDPDNPILASVLVPGYDFIRNSPGFASDLADINQSTAHILHQSTAHILHSYQMMQLNGTTVGLLDADTASALQGASLPSDFGHGTMVAGLIHLVAPTAKIMPLKAFNADGSADTADIIRAIYFAADNGARVINMSFGLPLISDALMKAVNYATRKGVICVASVGNDGQATLMYPAAFGNVIGVASVDQQNKQSTFSNFGPDLVTIAAPGEALITTYPGNHYAAVWGTSFSSALVSGAAVDLLSIIDPKIASQLAVGDITRAISKANTCGTAGSLGAGCLDFNQAEQFLHATNLPH
jgi:subtilisin family serine protease